MTMLRLVRGTSCQIRPWTASSDESRRRFGDVGDIEVASNIFAALLLLEVVLAAGSFVYTARTYFRTPRPRSSLFRMIARDDTFKIVAGIWLGGITSYRLWLLPPNEALPIWVPFASGIAVAILIFPIIDHAISIYRLRRAHGDGTPPPFDARD